MEMTDSQSTIIRLKKFFRERALFYQIEMSFLYGSFARGCPHTFSDIDLGIIFSEEIDEAQKIYFLITEITFELHRCLNREVNIVSIDKDFSHPMLYYNVIMGGIPLFIKDDDRFLNLKLEAVYQMEDFQIFGTQWQYEIAKRIMEENSYA